MTTWTAAQIEAHNAKVARDAQAARESPRPMLKLNEERPKMPSPCAQDGAVAVLEPEKASEQPTVWKFTVFGQPMGAPRQTRADAWKKRPCVIRYREWCDKARAATPTGMTKEPLEVSMDAFLEMPKSWSAKKRDSMRGKWHRQKPDGDNILKGGCDGLFESDCMIAYMAVTKRWDDGKGPRIEMEVVA